MAGVTQFLMQLLCSYEIVNQKCSTAGQSVCIWAAPSFPEGFSSIHFSFRFLASFHFPHPQTHIFLPIYLSTHHFRPTSPLGFARSRCRISACTGPFRLQINGLKYRWMRDECRERSGEDWRQTWERNNGGGKLQGTDKNLGVGGRRKKLGMRACIGCSVERSTGVTSPTAVPSNETDWHIQHPPTGA